MTTAMGPAVVASARAVGFASRARGGSRAVGRCLANRWAPARVHVARVSSDDGRGKTTRAVLRVETREHTRRERWEIAEHRARDARGGG